MASSQLSLILVDFKKEEKMKNNWMKVSLSLKMINPNRNSHKRYRLISKRWEREWVLLS